MSELRVQSNGKKENVRNCKDKVMERKKMSGTAVTKKLKEKMS